MKTQDKPKKSVARQIAYAVVPLICFLVVMLVSWTGNQLLYKFGIRFGTATDWPKIPLDDKIPLIPEFIYIYWLTWPVALFTFFYLAYKDKKAFFNLFITLIVSYLVSGFIYFFAQTYFTKPELAGNSFTEKLLKLTWGSCEPINCFPSQHCFMAFAIIIACFSGKKLNWFFRVFGTAFGLAVALSTLFCKQHFILDVFVSFDIMFLVWALAYTFKYGEKTARRVERRQLAREKKRQIKLAADQAVEKAKDDAKHSVKNAKQNVKDVKQMAKRAKKQAKKETKKYFKKSRK